MIRNAFAFVLFALSLGCTPEPEAVGDFTVPLWEEAACAFSPGSVGPNPDGWLRLDAGRILLKPFVFPRSPRRCAITLELELQSAGDPWDKVGSVFAMADESGRRFIDRCKEGMQADTTRFDGIMRDSTSAPPLELLRFITPFGVGHFSSHPKAESWRPVYVPEWETSVSWVADLSDFQPWFAEADTVWIGLHIDTWTAEGYRVTGRLEFDESDLACDLAPAHRILPLWNTMPLAHDQRAFTAFPTGPLATTVDLPAGPASLGLITTGHGGHEGGDEFTKQEHRIQLDGSTVLSWTPWRNDCASFRRFNPSSGAWLVEHGGREEQVASSDLSRSNWCPGSDVPYRLVPLGNLEAGHHGIELAIPGAQAMTADAFNFWNVSGYLRIGT